MPSVDIAIEPAPAAPLQEPQCGGSYRRNADGSLELAERTQPATGRREAAAATTPADASTATAQPAAGQRRAIPAPKE